MAEPQGTCFLIIAGPPHQPSLAVWIFKKLTDDDVWATIFLESLCYSSLAVTLTNTTSNFSLRLVGHFGGHFTVGGAASALVAECLEATVRFTEHQKIVAFYIPSYKL